MGDRWLPACDMSSRLEQESSNLDKNINTLLETTLPFGVAPFSENDVTAFENGVGRDDCPSKK